MAFDRDAIYSKLLSQLQAQINSSSTPPVPQPVSRRARDLTQIGPDEQPAVFLVAGDESVQEERGLTPKRTMQAHVLIYVRTDDPAQPPTSIMFPLMNLVERAVAFQAGDTPIIYGSFTTLGGLVSHCKLVSVKINDGLPTGEGTALMTFDILATGGVSGVAGG